MKDYSEIVRMLESELTVIEGRDRLDMNTLDITDKIVHTLKNICKIKRYHKHEECKEKMSEAEEKALTDSWEHIPKKEKDLRWYDKMMDEASTEEERMLITKLMNIRQERE